MNDLDHARSLLEMARSDFKAITNMMDPALFDDGIFGFHAQQAVEKSLKAWIAALGARFPKTHDISELIGVLESHSESIGEDALTLVCLYPFAVQYRYESIDTEDEPLNRKETLQSVSSLLRRVARFLEP
ncbi:MAG TPA: HEPN domain-containing protein [Thermoguttaceae bacterium]|nr:HEPN domain-containing protein [Thermoguttaceae bacterium]